MLDGGGLEDDVSFDGNTSGWVPISISVSSGIARRAFHCAHDKPAIRVIPKSSAGTWKNGEGKGKKKINQMKMECLKRNIKAKLFLT